MSHQLVQLTRAKAGFALAFLACGLLILAFIVGAIVRASDASPDRLSQLQACEAQYEAALTADPDFAGAPAQCVGLHSGDATVAYQGARRIVAGRS